GRPSIPLTTPEPELVTIPVVPSVRQPVPTAVEARTGPENSRIATPSSTTTSPQNWYDGCGAPKSWPADVPPTITTPSGRARATASSVCCGSTPNPSARTMQTFGSLVVAPSACATATRHAAS